MKRSALGVLLVVLGLLFLLTNLGILHGVTHFIFRWPNVMFLVALVLVISGKPKQAAIFVLIGGFFWAQDYFHLNWNLLWPVILIVVGVLFLFRERSSSSSESGEDTINESSIFSGSKKKISSQNFKGGKVTTIFGGCHLDLRDALPEDGAVIDIMCVFGGTEIRIPENWRLEVSASPIFGGISDERDDSQQDGPTLKIKGQVLFGGVGIKS